MSYDVRCYDLAAIFLSDHAEKNTEANRNELAQSIQDAIESTIEFLEPSASVEPFPSKSAHGAE